MLRALAWMLTKAVAPLRFARTPAAAGPHPLHGCGSSARPRPSPAAGRPPAATHPKPRRSRADRRCRWPRIRAPMTGVDHDAIAVAGHRGQPGRIHRRAGGRKPPGGSQAVARPLRSPSPKSSKPRVGRPVNTSSQRSGAVPRRRRSLGLRSTSGRNSTTRRVAPARGLPSRISRTAPRPARRRGNLSSPGISIQTRVPRPSLAA